MVLQLILTECASSLSTRAPVFPIAFIIRLISETSGIFSIIISSSVSNEPARIPSAAFFAPSIITSPANGAPPFIMKPLINLLYQKCKSFILDKMLHLN